MDIKSFLDRTNLSKADVLRKLGRDPKSSLLSAYQSGASLPSFDMALKLLKLGMTIKEMFGEEIDEIVRKVYMDEVRPEAADDQSTMTGVEKAIAAMKARGIIKDEVAKEIAAMKAKGLI